MIDDIIKNEQVGVYSKRQQLFVRYILFVLIDLVVLNLFNEFWEHVFIESFSISLLTAILLQVLMQITIAFEHRVAKLFKNKTSLKSKILRGITTWAILFVSKLVILEAIAFAFDDSVIFGGPIHGLISFIIVVVVIVLAEQLFLKRYKSLAK